MLARNDRATNNNIKCKIIFNSEKQRTRHFYMHALFVTKEEFGIGLFDIKSAAASFVKKGR